MTQAQHTNEVRTWRPHGRQARSVTAMLSTLFSVLTLALSVLLVGPGSLGVAGAAQPSGIAHATRASGPYTIEIHKFEQPDSFGDSASGLPQDTNGLTPVPGATFTAQRVAGIDPTTAAGQLAIGAMSVAQASDLVAGEPVLAEVTTDAHGNATIGALPAGLYLLHETYVPAGYVGSGAFLVALPLTDPANPSAHLDTVHVYPKNAKAGITLDVIDADAITSGDTIEWVSRSDIPNSSVIDGYEIHQILDDRLEYTGEITVELDCSACPGEVTDLVEGIDYEVTYDPATHTIVVEMTEAGLAKLETAVGLEPQAQVTITYETIVLDAGIITNEAVLYPSADAIETRQGVNDTATTKWGPLEIIVHEHQVPAHLIEGACFTVYPSYEDALLGSNPIVIDGVSTWQTDEQGRILLPVLRFSDHANGLDLEETDEYYRTYWAVATCIPDGWLWVDDSPLGGVVNDPQVPQQLIFEVVREDVPAPAPGPGGPEGPQDPGEGIPVTGAQVAGIVLLALVLIAGGFTAVWARKRRAEVSGWPVDG